MGHPDEIIRAAEEVAGILESRRVGAVVIGAVALAAHGYVRFTHDLDLGVNTDLGTLRNVAETLQMAGFAAADTVIRPGSRLRIDPLPYLVALRLYAGGTKSRADVVELLAHNPDADMTAIRDLCRGLRLRGLDPLIDGALSGS